MPAIRLGRESIVAWLALGWALFNCTYVYLYLHGAKLYRVESSVLILSTILLFLIVRQRQPAELKPPYSRFAPALFIIAVLSSLIFIYAPLLDFPFLSDDYVFLDLYRDGSHVFTTLQFFRPLFAALFVVLGKVGSGNAIVFHVAALVLHLGSAWLVFRLSKRLLVSTSAAWMCFALFALNPVQLESVLWISGLQELLWAFLMLAAMDCYTRKPVLSPAALFATLILIAGSLLAKETALCFILLLPAADGVLYQFRRGPVARYGYVLMVVELVSYLYLRQRFVTTEASFFVRPSLYFAKQLVRTPYAAFVQPWNIVANRVPLYVLWLATVSALVILTAAVVLGRVSRRVLVGPYIMLASTMPVYSFLYVAPDLLGSRYLYFPMFGWAVLTAELLCGLLRGRGVAVATGLLIGFSLLSLQLNLRPWTLAGHYVDYLTDQIQRGVSPDVATRNWQQSTGAQLRVVDGIAREYQGVTIFRNGFPQFLERVRISPRGHIGSGQPADSSEHMPEQIGTLGHQLEQLVATDAEGEPLAHHGRVEPDLVPR